MTRSVSTLVSAGALYVLCSAVASAHPNAANDGIRHAASYQSAATVGIAQGSLFVIFGVEMGPAEVQRASAYPLPTQLAGTSAKVTVGKTSLQAPLVYVSEKQLAGILPSNTPLGDGTITLTANGETGRAAPIKVLPSALGLFSMDQTGKGQAVLTDVTFKVNSKSQAFHPKQTVTAWATGIGKIDGNDAVAPQPQDMTVDLKILVGDQTANVTYKGRSTIPSIDQINFEIPEGVAGCSVPITMKLNGAAANSTTMSIAADGDACPDQ